MNLPTKEQTKAKAKLERSADVATKWIGSTKSLIFHTIFFACAFLLPVLGANFDRVLLVLTTALSLEAIYLAIFIQMSVNKNTADIEEIQEDIEEISDDVDEIQKDVDEIQEDIEEISDDDEDTHLEPIPKQKQGLEAVQATLARLQKEIDALKK